jgi:hypothetical protein
MEALDGLSVGASVEGAGFGNSVGGGVTLGAYLLLHAYFDVCDEELVRFLAKYFHFRQNGPTGL